MVTFVNIGGEIYFLITPKAQHSWSIAAPSFRTFDPEPCKNRVLC